MQPGKHDAAPIVALEQAAAQFLADARTQENGPEIISPPLAPRSED
jgi:hypothetical protein